MNLSFDSDSLLMNLPFSVFWKSMDHTILGGNKAFKHLVGSSMIGRRDCDTPWARYAELYYRHELDTHQGIIYPQLEPLVGKNGFQVMLTEKKPLFDADGRICGIIGSAIKITNKLLLSFTYELDKGVTLSSGSAIIISDENYLERKLNIGKLTKREMECFYYILRGYTAKSIATKLNLSVRTVECHLNNVKSKLGCRCKSELIDFAEEHGLMRFVPKNIFDQISSSN
ncbi:MAG: LuxR C-terminal-related transcriptional regulator [Gammaproteobacteria bacterium]